MSAKFAVTACLSPQFGATGSRRAPWRCPCATLPPSAQVNSWRSV